MTIPQIGRPFLSTYARNFGAMPRSARACIVRVDAKVHELATLMTETVMMALKIDGRILIPASLIAITNGLNLVCAPEAFNRFSLSEGTMRPRMNRDKT